MENWCCFVKCFSTNFTGQKLWSLTALKIFSDNNMEGLAFSVTRVLYLSAGAFYNLFFISLTVSIAVKVKSNWGWTGLVIAVFLIGHGLYLGKLLVPVLSSLTAEWWTPPAPFTQLYWTIFLSVASVSFTPPPLILFFPPSIYIPIFLITKMILFHTLCLEGLIFVQVCHLPHHCCPCCFS